MVSHESVRAIDRLTLHVDAPVLVVQVKRLEGALLAQALRLVDELVAAIVPGTGVALGVLVCRGSVLGTSALCAEAVGITHSA